MTIHPTAERRRKPITVTELNAIREPGRHSIGEGLLFVVNASGSKSWIARLRDPNGKRRDMGLGRFPDVKLAEARERAAELRRQVRDGLDPVAEKRKASAVIPSFRDAAERVHGERKGGFRNAKHADQWLNTLRDYTFPMLGNRAVNEVDGPAIVACLKPIWLTKPETARRVLQRIGTVIAWAAAHGFREHEAPMRAIRMGLPPQPKGKAHHPALPYVKAADAIAALRAKPESVARLALEFAILTAARSSEARGARWSEIDMDAATWTVPAERIKMSVEHIVPLSTPAMAILSRLHPVRSGEVIFPGVRQRSNRDASDPILSDVALSKANAEIAPGYTVHGWRSTFRDWTAEETNTPSEVAEKALAHAIPNAVERAYRRGDLLEKRRKLMDAWAVYLAGQPANVVALKGAAA